MTTTTSAGTTVTVEDFHDDRAVICDNPKAPTAFRHQEVGRIIEGAFQPAAFSAFGLSPETLRIIADLIEKESA